jgi:tyrosyl-tRNA synthetase
LTASTTEDGGTGLGGLLADLEWRGILHATRPGLPERLAAGRPISAYIGFDPSADSLHVGHLVPIFGLIRLQRHGGRPVALVGGGTGMIGDPSGRSSERNLLDAATIEHNVASIRVQLERFLDFAPGPTQAVMANNLDWLGKISLIEYLRDVGKHFTVPYMLAKDSVQQRLDRGLSFTEFSYMTLQALDFATLYRDQGVEMQMGGADQWGNITAGLESSGAQRRRGGGSPAHGIAYKAAPPSGAKFGRARARDSVAARPSAHDPLRVLPVLVQADDRDAGTYLRWFTEFTREEVEALDAEVVAHPEQRRPDGTRVRRDRRVHGEVPADAVQQVGVLPSERRNSAR